MLVRAEELYEVDSDVPDLSGTVLLHHLDGFMDAGAAGRVLAEHLLNTYEHRVIARFDVDNLIDYRARRPAMIYDTDRWQDYQRPEIAVYLLHDDIGTPFLLLTGMEPDYRWEAFIDAVLSLIERWGVRLTVGFHGIPMGVPHTRPLGVVTHATRSGLITEQQPLFSQVRVPGNVAGLLELRLGEAGLDAVGFAGQVPHYLAQSTYPSVSITLLDQITRATGLALSGTALYDLARQADVELHRQVADSEEIAQVVGALERQYDAYTEAQSKNLLLETGQAIPTAEELGAEFERFLAEQEGFSGPERDQ